MKIGGRPEPVVVAITSDDLWLAVICQANLEIAGSPRKVFRDRPEIWYRWGRALDGSSTAREMIQSNSEYNDILPGDSHTGLSSCDEREKAQILI